MAFPTTGIFDNFNRANAANLGANWATFVTGDPTLRIVSNTAEPASTWNGNVWTTVCAGANQEIWVKFASVNSSGAHGIYARVQQDATATPDGYGVEYQGGVIKLGRLDNNAFAVQAGQQITQTLAAGDSMGLECIGTTIKGYYKLGAGAWTLFGTFTDATYSAGRKLGIEIQNGSPGAYDEVGGGDVVTSTLTPITIPAGLTMTPTMVLTPAKSLPVAATLTAVISRVSIRPKTIAANLTLTPVIQKLKLQTLSASVSANPVITFFKRRFVTLTGGVTLTPVIARVNVLPRALAAVVTLTPVISRLGVGQKTLSVTTTLTAALTKIPGKQLISSLVLTPVITKLGKYYKTLSASLTLAPTITRLQLLKRSLPANVTAAAQIQLIRTGHISLIGNLTFTNAVARKVNKTLNSVVNLAGNIQVQKISGGPTLISLSATMTAGVALAKVHLIKKLLSLSLLLDSKLSSKKIEIDLDKDWLLSAKGVAEPQLDGAKLDEAVLERTML